LSKTVLVLDIDGVVCESQEPIRPEMLSKIVKASFKMPVYFCTGNTFTKSMDMLEWHGMAGIFCLNGHELRDGHGYKLWEDVEADPLPRTITSDIVCRIDKPLENNSIEWRTPSFVNFCPVGRFATIEQRNAHDASWRSGFIEVMKTLYPNIELSAGGKVSVDICSNGANKSRAAKYLNDSGYNFIYIGDKTAPGGNDYPIVEYVKHNDKNLVLTSTGTSHTMSLMDEVLNEQIRTAS